jgi:uncharacterized protein (DUF433 family)
MTEPAEKIDHPYIVSRADYCGGSPVIKGTKFPVRSVVNYVLRQGISPEELVGEFSHLTSRKYRTRFRTTMIIKKRLTRAAIFRSCTRFAPQITMYWQPRRRHRGKKARTLMERAVSVAAVQ